MQIRPLGKTGVSASVVGLGAWQLGNPEWGADGAADPAEIVHAALDAGCTFFDTAPGYGSGRSEEVLGRTLREVRSRVAICTKFGHHTGTGEASFAAADVRPALEASLRRLQTDYVDVYLLHNPPREVMDGTDSPLYEELERLRDEGKIRAYGVSADWAEEIDTVLDTTGSGALEVLLNVFHQEPIPALRRAAAKGVGSIVKVPLDSGWLSGRYGAESRFEGVRARWTPDVVRRRAALVGQVRSLLPDGVSLPHAALAFVLAQPSVATVIPGAKSPEQVRDNFAAAQVQLSPDVLAALHDLWEREIADDPLPW